MEYRIHCLGQWVISSIAIMIPVPLWEYEPTLAPFPAQQVLCRRREFPPGHQKYVIMTLRKAATRVLHRDLYSFLTQFWRPPHATFRIP